MIIYLNFIIPILAIVILSVIFHKHVNLLERLLVFSVVAIIIIAVKALSIIGQTSTPECLNSYAVRANYYEDWDEWIDETCTRCIRSDSTGCIEEEEYDCSYRKYHDSYWEIIDNVGKTYNVPESKYRHLLQLWGSKAKFEDLHRDYYRDDGDLWYTLYDNVFEHTCSIVRRGTYQNKVKCSRSIFNFKTITPQEKSMYGLYDYPQMDRYDYNPIIGFKDYRASKRLSFHNAHIGSFKQVHMLIVVFKNKSYDAALYQESLWKGGNKNEFILCIGVNDVNEIQWTKVISWTEVQELKIGLESKIKKMSFDLSTIADTMAKDVRFQFKRKEFKDFNYLTVEPTTTAVILSFIITLIATVVMSIVVIKYEITLNGIK